MSWGVMAGQLGWNGLIDEGWRKGPWTAEEDRLLIEYVRSHGEGRWNSVARLAGLKRNGKSCRLRWVNYLRPDLKRGQITPHEENIILELHSRWGNRWSTIARSLPRRTDNEIKNYWRTHFKKKAKIVPENSDKARTRILKRQQFQQQQQQKHEQQQQQQQLLLQQQQQKLLQLNQLDMKKIISLLDENNNYENKVASSYVHPHQIRQQQQPEIPNIFYHPNNTTSSTADHHQSGLLHMCNNTTTSTNNNNCSGSHDQACNEENVLWDGLWNLDVWDGLWNLDDVHGYFGACGSTKPTIHNLVAPFC